MFHVLPDLEFLKKKPVPKTNELHLNLTKKSSWSREFKERDWVILSDGDLTRSSILLIDFDVSGFLQKDDILFAS